ncbi:dipeptide ABC transporter ATP-binding protein [Ornithinimicrobium cavernae]|uniref:dipeptide ABC transporter ATP-binding protein n=1 Tax=Ornithinimicrobium cavernae TaxID=2666047 RepID=UPI00192A24F8|nr:ABC transporter ATP-binding protein [Ornithinimicrobium cavernae]
MTQERTSEGAGPVLSLEQVTVGFDTDSGVVEAVRGLDLQVGRGEIVALVGESGSGKTVTAHTILQMVPENARITGRITLAGADVLSLSGEDLRLLRGSAAAMVFQEPSTALNPVFPIGWQIADGIRAHQRIGRRAARARAVDLLRKVGLPDPEQRVDFYPHQLSGGQKQRVVIAMALALDAQLIIADEPTTALDVTVQAEVLEVLRRLRDDFGRSVLLITHNMGVVADLADRVAVMRHGELVEVADVADLFAQPRHDYTRELLASVPRLRAAAGEPIRSTPPNAEAPPVVVAEGLAITFPGRLGRPAVHAVRHVSFSVAPGEVLGLVGESGSGKTTISRAVAGLVGPTGGSLTVLGQEFRGARERDIRPLRQQIGFVFQDPATSFNPKLSIGDCVAEPLRVHRRDLTEAQLRARVASVLDMVQLSPALSGRFPHELSGGQRQRASLARALALDPALLIADEPTSALDVSVQARVLEVFAELHRELSFAAIFVTHDLAVVGMVADRVGVLRDGRLVELGPTASVLASPQEEYTQQLLAAAPVPDPAEQATRRTRWQALVSQPG